MFNCVSLLLFLNYSSYRISYNAMEFEEGEGDHSRRKRREKEAVELGHKYEARLVLWVFQVGREGPGR